MTWVTLYFSAMGGMCGWNASKAYTAKRKGALGFWVIMATCNLAMAGYVDNLEKLVTP